MRTLPRASQLYLIAIWSISIALFSITLLGREWRFDQLHLLLLWLVWFVLADYFEFEFATGRGDPVRFTIYEGPMVFLVAVSGNTGVVVVVIGTFIVGALQRREWYRNLFNGAERSITYLTMVLVYTTLSAPGQLPFSGFAGVVTFFAIAGSYYTLNTLMVGTIIALASRQPLLQVYRESFRLIYWVHLITLPLGGLLAVLWQIDPWLLVLGVLPLIMAQGSFKAVAAWRAESLRSRALAGKLERLQGTATAMIASLEPEPLLETVSTRLAALLEAAASWVVLLDGGQTRLVAACGIPIELEWRALAYAAELQRPGLRQLDAGAMEVYHDAGQVPWRTLVIIPLALESRVLGGICLALDRPMTLAEDDRRVLLAFAAQAALAMEHARLFEELRHKQDELIRSSKLAALGTFSAGIAHEFNNLLAGVLGFAQLGLHSSDVALKDEALQVAVQSCVHGRSITSGLLTFARRGEPQHGLHQLSHVIEETLTLVERELAKLNIRVERRLQPVPEVVCDPGQISQVLLNLITNARDAMAERGGVVTIELARRGEQVEVLVRDTGVGIPRELLDQVFQPFMTTKGALGGSTTPGTGLGLAISYGIIESHGGTITIKSVVAQGTTVTLRLPIGGAVSEPSAPQSDSLAALDILIVDDEPVLASSLARLLETHGHRVTVATNGETALRRYCERSFDLVISDVVMPGMSGVEFLRRLRLIDPQAQVLVMTGQAGSRQTEQMLRLGAFDVVSKPFGVAELLAVIAQWGAGAPAGHTY